MNITPRKTEVAAVVALLEAEGYDSAEALAKDLIKVVWEQLLERDTYALLYEFKSGPPVIAYGPFSGEGEVTRFAAKIPFPGPARIGSLQLFSPARQQRIDAIQRKAAEPIVCASCDHPQGTHEHTGAAGKCQMKGCRCRKLEEAKAA